jgi:crotonobetainyl-CoA:carnitine CoA-transferase CaiB-like acyl-CoA transferase
VAPDQNFAAIRPEFQFRISGWTSEQAATRWRIKISGRRVSCATPRSELNDWLKHEALQARRLQTEVKAEKLRKFPYLA